ncbi:MAG: hypothetical protein ABI605_11510 [Rhizobacter sp.]
MQTLTAVPAAGNANGSLAPHEAADPASTAVAKPVTDRASATWKRLDEAVSPVLGRRGMGALYQRSLRLATSTNPWLKDAWQDGSVQMDLTRLEAVLSMQTATTAGDGSEAMQQAFRDLLSMLIGAELTERMLRPAGAHAVRDSHANAAGQ